MNSELYIQATNISKSYEKVQALKNISFEIEKNESFGFIGPDGAGKTSLFRIITTLLLPDSGSIKIGEHDVIKNFKKTRKIIGYMPGSFSLYQDLSVEENLEFFATVFGTTIKENYDLIRDIYSQIEPFKKRKAGKLSGGMKQKLALSCALIHKPELLVLDEPTTGVDAVSRKEFWQMLKQLKEQGITIIVSTPYMDEASLCDRVALIDKGEIMKTNTPDNIVSGFNKKVYSVKAKNIYLLLNDLKAYEYTYSAFPFGQDIHLILKNDNKINEILGYLKEKNHISPSIEPINPNIEDCFIDFMKTR